MFWGAQSQSHREARLDPQSLFLARPTSNSPNSTPTLKQARPPVAEISYCLSSAAAKRRQDGVF